WKTKPLGLEQQVTIWGYNNTGVVGNIIFKKFKLIYKGTATTPVNGLLTDAYLCHWSDPDLGDAGDDYAGCDTALSVGYVYNSKPLDIEYQKFGIIPPAIGFDFLQGPIIKSLNDTAIFNLKYRPGFKNLPMTSFIYFASTGTYSDPGFNLNGSWQWYSMFLGGPPTPQPPPFPEKLIDPVTKVSTSFWLSGDPVTNSNPFTNSRWIDGLIEQPADRRILQTSGPFTMALGDTQEIVVGVVGGIGDNYIQSISAMKANDRYVQTMYTTLFQLIPPSLSVNVSYPNSLATIEIKATTTPSKFSTLKAIIYGDELSLFDDGAHSDGDAGDGVYANIIAFARSHIPVSVGLIMTTADRTVRVEKMVEQVTIAGPVTIENVTVYSDNINNDKIVNNGEYIQYGVTVKNNTSFTLQDVNVAVYSTVDFNPERDFGAMTSGEEKTLQYNGNDIGTFFSFRVPLNYQDGSYPLAVQIRDGNGNLWKVPLSIPVVQQSFIADSLKITPLNIVGSNDGLIGFVLYNPAIAGETYDVWYGGNNSTRNWTVVKNISGIDYATVYASLSAANQTPPINTLPNALGYGTFTINDAKTQVTYSIAVTGMTGPVTMAGIFQGGTGIVGSMVTSLPFVGNVSSGQWSIPDSLVDDFTAGNLYVNVTTGTNPAGEIRGQISDGLLSRKNFPNESYGNNIFSYQENRLIGFSLFVGNAPIGAKTVMQTAPSLANVFNTVNPENTYRILPLEMAAAKNDESNIEIRFLSGTHWAITAATLPSLAKFIRVPFAVFKDTVRVIPVITNGTTTDTVWNIDPVNGFWNGKPIFDNISGICDSRTTTNTDLSYYSPTNAVFPPISNAVKARYINGANHIAKDIAIVNESGDGNPPANGTIIRLTKYLSVKIGDIKSFTLTPLGVAAEQLSVVPADYLLSQNYPNPFNPSTRIEFSLPQQVLVSLKIYDVIGREVATILNEEISAGRFAVEWNGKNRFNQPAASGVYFYQLTAGQFAQSRKMILLK
ncbi:MAG: CHRD domain-containing protein, partial [Bacteroidetes bacterium]|nr:CHRD domain-containing protein [Bacteroidota bacterium]